MPQELVEPDVFLDRLGQVFSDPSSSGTVRLTHKRYAHEDKEDDVKMGADEGEEYDILIRCSAGPTKFSARIPASRLVEFHARYGSLMKASMAPHMRKRDKKREKARADAIAKKRKELYVDVQVGSQGKRGKGRRQRMRKIAAQKKKEGEREKVEQREAQQKASAKETQ